MTKCRINIELDCGHTKENVLAEAKIIHSGDWIRLPRKCPDCSNPEPAEPQEPPDKGDMDGRE